MRIPPAFSFFCACALTASFSALSHADDETGSPNGEWIVLFDGSSTDAWRGFRESKFPEAGWEVEGDTLRTVPGGPRPDIITHETFSHFELELEWKVAPGGNSGIFFHVSEEPPVIWHWAPEIQILDDRNLAPDHLHAAGGFYDIYGPSEEKELAPVGEFNKARLIVRANKVEHWLNGEKILAFDLDAEETRERIEESKFGENFATEHEGHIGLQHHGNEVGFRNIRVRELPPTE